MNKVIEVDFLPRETDVAFSWLDSIGDSARRILIVDNDKNSDPSGQNSSRKDRPLSGVRRKRRRQSSSERPEFSAGPDLARYSDAGDRRRRNRRTNPGRSLNCNTRQSFFSQRSSRGPRRTLVSTSTNTHFSPSQSTFKS